MMFSSRTLVYILKTITTILNKKKYSSHLLLTDRLPVDYHTSNQFFYIFKSYSIRSECYLSYLFSNLPVIIQSTSMHS